MKVKSEREVTQSCLTLSDPMDCSLPDSSVHGIFQAGVLEWGAIAFSEVSAVVSNCVRSHGQQPTRLLCPQASPDKNSVLPWPSPKYYERLPNNMNHVLNNICENLSCPCIGVYKDG